MECHSELVEALGNNALPYLTIVQDYLPYRTAVQSFSKDVCHPAMSNVRDDRSVCGKIVAPTVLSRHFAL
ncbi:hypothetical protein TNCV_670441 [Trichonephila clavipes]|nr:hypothetical protein TNCV_670441 [Trichonephila clavipes]